MSTKNWWQLKALSRCSCVFHRPEINLWLFQKNWNMKSLLNFNCQQDMKVKVPMFFSDMEPLLIIIFRNSEWPWKWVIFASMQTIIFASLDFKMCKIKYGAPNQNFIKVSKGILKYFESILKVEFWIHIPQSRASVSRNMASIQHMLINQAVMN